MLHIDWVCYISTGYAAFRLGMLHIEHAIYRLYTLHIDLYKKHFDCSLFISQTLTLSSPCRFRATCSLFTLATSLMLAAAMLPPAPQTSPYPTVRHDALHHRVVRRDVVTPDSEDGEQSATVEKRQSRGYRLEDKSFGLYDYPVPPYFRTSYVPDIAFDQYGGSEGSNDILARTDPLDNIIRPKNTIAPYSDSPIYYIRLPPTPYVFVPGLGYVSQPSPPPPPAPLSSQINPFINLPIDFIANGKPTNIYQWSGAPAMETAMTDGPSLPSYPYPKPKPDSSVNNLNKGPYIFNGRPSDVYVLRDSVNAIYSDALQNFYP